MTEGTLVGGLLLSSLVAAAFLFVGMRTWRRAAASSYARPMRALAWFWYGLAAATLADAALTVIALLDPSHVQAAYVVMQVRIITTLGALYGLVYHLLFIYLGKGHGRLLAGAYLGLLVLIEWTAHRLGLAGVAADPWRGWYAWSIPATTPEYYASITVLWIPPVVMGALYWRLSSQVEDPAARFRGHLLSVAIIGYFASTYLGFLDFHNAWWGLTQHVLGLVMALMAVWAMQPPAWAQRRWGARAAGLRRATQRQREEAMKERMAMLI